MLDLAVATAAETFTRMREPLADRGIHAQYLQSRERILPLSDLDVGEFDVGFVYPPRYMEGAVVDAFLDIPWVNNRDAVLDSRNKGGVIARLGRAGIPVPKTVMVSNPVEESSLIHAFNQFDPPIVVKPNSATHGIGVTKVHDLDALLGVADYFEAIHEFEPVADRTYLLQEYLPNARDYRVMVIAGNYVGAVERRLANGVSEPGRWKRNVHRNAVAEGIDLSSTHRDLAERTAATLDIDYLGVDLLVTGDRVVVAETNARATIDDDAKYEPEFYDKLAAVIRAQVN